MYETVWGDWERFEFLLRTFTLMSIWEMQVVCSAWCGDRMILIKENSETRR